MFADKRSVVIITGASGELGSKFAEEFAKSISPQSLLILSSRSRSRLGDLKARLSKTNPGLNIALAEWNLTKPDLKVFQSDLASFTDKGEKYDRAIVVHNAAILGDMSHKVSQFGHHLDNVQESLNVNLLSLLALNTAFLETFKDVPVKFIVSLTAPSATQANPSFGYSAIVKSAKYMVLNVLAKEEPSVKVLHFDPVLVDTEALRVIRDQSHDGNIRNKFSSFYADGNVLSGEQVAGALVKLLTYNKFTSGETVSALQAMKMN